MCGIFGLIASTPGKISVQKLKKLTKALFNYSETRGKDASGVLSITDRAISFYKEPNRARHLLKQRQFAAVISAAEQSYGRGGSFAVAGHTRMVTNGSADNPDNNQPVVKNSTVLLHNGIIVNDAALWAANPAWQREFQVDTEVFSELLAESMRAGNAMAAAMRQAFRATMGANTIAAMRADCDSMWLGTTNGSLYYWSSPEVGLTLFASEAFILRQALDALAIGPVESSPPVIQVTPGELLSISLSSGATTLLKTSDQHPHGIGTHLDRDIVCLNTDLTAEQTVLYLVSSGCAEIERHMEHNASAIAALRRCSHCLLPETFPFIEFDAQGICQFCRQHRPIPLRGAEELHKLAENFRGQKGNRPDCLVPISGGRDSCYGLHYIKEELGLNPVAYTYDWGFVTDLARRNISRMCGALGVEHVLVAADIRQKRHNVRKNVTAWLAKPALSMIPLFMAGDKAFFYYASMIREQMDLGPILFSMNWLEKTGFKTGFAGVNDTAQHDKTYGLTPLNQLKLIWSYGQNFLTNPKYLNGSLLDTAFGYFSYYLQKKNYYSIFDFLTWNQAEVENCIIGNYGWETSPDTKSTWRIGDGTAPFYNYIYMTIAGFCENDTFRSNQIREGLIDRETAMRAIEEENRPRAESFKWYCDAIGIDAVMALKTINQTKKLYAA